jgi:hypothetical protein
MHVTFVPRLSVSRRRRAMTGFAAVRVVVDVDVGRNAPFTVCSQTTSLDARAAPNAGAFLWQPSSFTQLPFVACRDGGGNESQLGFEAAQGLTYAKWAI